MKHLTLSTDYGDAYTIVAKYTSKGYLCHGGPEEFNEFDPAYIQGGSRGEYGYGFYFCNEAYKPINYGNQMYFVKENAFNLCNLNTNDNPLEDLEGLAYNAQKKLENAHNVREYEYYSKLCKQWQLSFEEENYLEFFNKGFQEGYGAKNALKYALNYVPGNFNPKNLANLFVKLGYDGIIAENQYVIFNIPKLNQNLLEITLDDNNNPIIPESKMTNIDRIITESINNFLIKENCMDDMIKSAHAAINNSPLGVIKKALPDVDWTISGDYGYRCIKDYANDREFRLYKNGDLYFLYGYNANSGAWGDYVNEVKIDNIEELMQQPNWYRKLCNGQIKASKHEPNIIMGI